MSSGDKCVVYRVVRACQVMEETANDILKQIPQLVDLEEVSDKYPVLYEQSMNTVLIQEIIRSVPVKRSHGVALVRI